MTDARWQQVKALFQATVDRPASERAAFLAAAVGGDEELRREIESLLNADSSDPGFTDRLPFRDHVAQRRIRSPGPSRQAKPREPDRPSSGPRAWDSIASSACWASAGWGRCFAPATAN